MPEEIKQHGKKTRAGHSRALKPVSSQHSRRAAFLPLLPRSQVHAPHSRPTNTLTMRQGAPSTQIAPPPAPGARPRLQVKPAAVHQSAATCLTKCQTDKEAE